MLEITILKNPMRSPLWVFEGNLGLNGFTDQINEDIENFLSYHNLPIDEIKEQLGLNTIKIDIFEFYSEYNETGDILGELYLLEHLITYYSKIKCKLERYVLKELTKN